MAQGYNAPFWFEVHDMYDNLWMNLPPRAPHWLPQRVFGSNVDAAAVELADGALIPGFPQSRKGVHNGYKYCFNGHNALAYHASLAPDTTPYRTVSVYHDRSVIYHVNYNAATNAVGEANVGTHNNMFMDWEEIKFRHGLDGSSRIDTNAHNLLQMTREQSIWPQSLLSTRYHPEVHHRNVQNAVTPQGCLGGNLALLIALVALSASPEHQHAVHDTLLGSLNGSNWAVAQQDGNPGWINRRGLIVFVYAVRGENGIFNSQDLANWETHGVMFP